MNLAEWMPYFVAGTELTLLLTFTSMAFGLTGGMILALARLDSRRRIFYIPATAVVELIRGTPLIVQLFYLFFVLPQVGIRLDPVPTGIIGLGINYSAYLSEVYRAGIVAVDRGQWEAAAALGLPSGATYRRIILPQAIRIVIPPIGNMFIGLFKDTALVSTISVQELLFSGKILASTNFRYFEIFTIIAIIYFILSYPASLGVRWLERHLRYER
jgi:amine acid ABC transporter, permease protein, 3-TM region, His/Glu/Gln/Arg/opine family